MELRMLMIGIVLVSAITKCSAINCLECSDVPNPAVCNKVVTCQGDANCLIKQYITTSGALLYSSSCMSKQGCSALQKRDVINATEDESKDILACQECCDSHDFCNIEGCSTTLVDRTQRGPYCFECNVENDVYGCRTTTLCDQAYSCSLHKSRFAGLYVAKCIPDTECQTIQADHTGVSADIIGKRSDPGITIPLPYCCKGDFCNDIRMFVNNASLSVDGAWTAWSAWSSCSKTCGYGGEERRSRSCDNPPPQNGGSPCVGDGDQLRDCLIQECPIDGGWSLWGNWSSCNLACGTTGQHTRSRTCDNPRPKHNGAFCQGDHMEFRDCEKHECTVDGAWSSWGAWGNCPGTCGTHLQTRVRACDNPAPHHQGANCTGSDRDAQLCSHPPCPVDGAWSSWGAWGNCPGTCGTHLQTRVRACDNPAPHHQGANCTGSDRDIQLCSHPPCPADIIWSDWTAWSACSHSCGYDGMMEQHRTCTHLSHAHYGACTGVTKHARSCNHHPCPVDGAWSEWTGWSSCSHTCGHNYKARHRTCDNPPPAHNGTHCMGSNIDSSACPHTQACPVDGAWSEWTGWSSCSHTCGHGYMFRHRSCDNPHPAHNGTHCSGPFSDHIPCIHTQACPVSGHWSLWSGWSSCTVSCGVGGSETRHRACNNPAPDQDGRDCVGHSSDARKCSVHTPCPVDGGWSSWSNYTQCSHTCGSGSHTRHRSCNNPAPAHNGKDCEGSATMDRHCAAPSQCPVDGQWSDWGAWAQCSHTCGSGVHVRHRACNSPAPAHHGAQCVGSSFEGGHCINDQSCPPADPCKENGFETVHNGDHDLCVKVFLQGTSWAEARRKCQQYPHGDLVVIPHYPYIHSIQQFLQSKHHHATSFWIGLLGPADPKDDWIWVNHERVNHGHFQGSYSHADDRRCGILRSDFWVSEHCASHYPFVCQINMQ